MNPLIAPEDMIIGQNYILDISNGARTKIVKLSKVEAHKKEKNLYFVFYDDCVDISTPFEDALLTGIYEEAENKSLIGTANAITGKFDGMCHCTLTRVSKWCTDIVHKPITDEQREELRKGLSNEGLHLTE
jgi:hypothetical protein